MNLQLSDWVRGHQPPEVLAAMGYILPEVVSPTGVKLKCGKMTKTEARFLREVLEPDHAVYDVLFQPCVFHLRNGHRYRPDFYCRRGEPAICHCMMEVKGGYRLGSYQRARLAFDQARIEWPMFRWQWWEIVDNEWRLT